MYNRKSMPEAWGEGEGEKEEGVGAVGVRSQEVAALSVDRGVMDKTSLELLHGSGELSANTGQYFVWGTGYFCRLWHAMLYMCVHGCVCVVFSSRWMIPRPWIWRWMTPKCGFLPRNPSLTQPSSLTPRSGRFARSCPSTGSIPPLWAVRAGGITASKRRLLTPSPEGIPTGQM